MLLETQIHQTLGWLGNGSFYKGNSKCGLNNVMHMARNLLCIYIRWAMLLHATHDTLLCVLFVSKPHSTLSNY